MDTQEAASEYWDAIIVGAGMAGGTLGYALARKGLRVLFCEKGSSRIDTPDSLTGDYAERFLPSFDAHYGKNRSIMVRAGRWWEEIDDRSYLFPHRFVPFIGSGAGGSSALFGMAMERFFPSDFTPLINFRDQGTSLPEEWPISYNDLLPYYEEAEELFRLRGTADALRADAASLKLAPPPTMTNGGEALFNHFAGKGLHPYRLPLACEYVPECQCCQSYLCAKKCKNDSGRICLEPAIQKYGAVLLDNCEVLSLDSNHNAVGAVNCCRAGEKFKLRGRVVILAAGALTSPAILLNSCSTDWPNGLANDSGLVGRNLMRHYIDLYLVDLNLMRQNNRFKELAFNDFYSVEGEKLGTVQSFGRLPPVPIMTRTLREEMKWPGLGSLLGLATPLAKGVMAKLVERSTTLASIIEDPPYMDNRITLAPEGGIRLHYCIHPKDKRRISTMRRLVMEAVSPLSNKIVKQAENNHRIAHVCGTCRFGTDPKSSVLDSFNRAHGLDNLYVADASFFPSSAGTNPALTIAANALRIAHHLSNRIC